MVMRPVAGERHEVGAPAGAQRHLGDQRQPLGAQPPADAAADGERALRLPPVGRQRQAFPGTDDKGEAGDAHAGSVSDSAVKTKTERGR